MDTMVFKWFKLELNLSVSVFARSFDSPRPGSYMKTWRTIGGPKVVGTLLQYLGR
jgi:hypothetical protein